MTRWKKMKSSTVASHLPYPYHFQFPPPPLTMEPGGPTSSSNVPEGPLVHPYYPYADYHYPPGQHWLAGPNVHHHHHPVVSEHNYNAPAGSSAAAYLNLPPTLLPQPQQHPHPHHHQPLLPCHTHAQHFSIAHGIQPSQTLSSSSEHHSNNNHNNSSNGGNGSSGGGFPIPPPPYHHLQQQSPGSCAAAGNANAGGRSSLTPSSSLFSLQGVFKFGSNNNGVGSMGIGSSSGRVSGWASSITADSPYPGGLEILWRELPEECQKLLTYQDIPDSARFRGYHTVCELLLLKRTLQGRLNSSQSLGMFSTSRSQETTANGGTESNGNMENCGVGMAVKEAMNALEEVSTASHGNNNNGENQPEDGGLAMPGKCPEVAAATTGNNNKDAPPGELDNSDNLSTSSSSTAPVVSQPQTKRQRTSSGKSVIGSIGLDSSSSSYSSSCGLANGNSNAALSVSSSSPAPPPPPPYRTAQLVFKLLQIGHYKFRSFSEINPNRLRVLFNTQRITYECHLSLVRPPKDSIQPLRKILTIDIGFDQISLIRFGVDKLFMRVEGPPVLTVTYNPCNDDNTCPPLTEQDYFLLEQIDKGQLKLSPCHQLYFLNERLVHLLEAQFKEHPIFKNVIQHAPLSDFDGPDLAVEESTESMILGPESILS